MGPGEAVIILLIVLVLFGPTLVAFFMGYSLGKKRATTPASSTQVDDDTGAGKASAPDDTDTGDGPGKE